LLLVSVAVLVFTPAALAATGSISGTVTEATGGKKPIKGVGVIVLNSATRGFARFASTDANGKYTATELAPGSYKVEFFPEFETNFVPQFYKEAKSFGTASSVEVKEGVTTENINAALQEGGEISGTVTDAATHAPLGEVCVFANNSVFERFGQEAVTTANGKYTIRGLEQGSYNLEFEYCPEQPGVQFIMQLVNGVSVTPGSATAIGNVALIRRAPVNTAPPTMSGTPAVEQKLSCSKGSWTGVLPLFYTYAWLRDGTAIPGALANTYVVQPADQGHALACQVTATNSVSRTSATSNTVNVPVPPPPPSAPPPPPVPTIESVTQSNSVWSEGGKLATFSRRKKARVGTTISFVLNEPASVSFAFTQQLGGRRVKGRCVTQTKKNRNKPTCRRTVTQGTLSFPGHAGLNKVVFQGRISPSKRLGLGAYALGITATNSVGERSSPRSLNFTIVK
jgi:hypothetical protein